jgi:plastocyanin
MKRKAAMVLLISSIGLAGLSGSPARGSGGFACHLPVSMKHTSEATIKDYCFKSTVTFVEPGDSVTWTNLDPEKHNVVGANGLWYSRPMKPQDAVTLRFRVPGVFPYYCQFHFGMTGVVVVGDPDDGKIGLAPPPAVEEIESREAGESVPLAADGVEQVDTEPASDAVNDTSWFWVFLVLLAALFVAGMIFLALMGRRGGRE